jgi:hypothetical protein
MAWRHILLPCRSDDFGNVNTDAPKRLHHNDSVHARILLFVVPGERAPISVPHARFVNIHLHSVRRALVHRESRCGGR